MFSSGEHKVRGVDDNKRIYVLGVDKSVSEMVLKDKNYTLMTLTEVLRFLREIKV